MLLKTSATQILPTSLWGDLHVGISTNSTYVLTLLSMITNGWTTVCYGGTVCLKIALFCLIYKLQSNFINLYNIDL